ncbi:MAG TPA: hypothetical protein VE641_16400 [Chthoniobacterales bacterium]|nr:hypothetical protein [Chthoniobacterales bacterium]
MSLCVLGCTWFTGHASSAALGYYTGIETAEFQETQGFLLKREESLHQDRSELPRPKTVTNAWPKTDETKSAQARSVKKMVAIKLYSQRIARITFASFTERRSSSFIRPDVSASLYYKRIATAKFQ